MSFAVLPIMHCQPLRPQLLGAAASALLPCCALLLATAGACAVPVEEQPSADDGAGEAAGDYDRIKDLDFPELEKVWDLSVGSARMTCIIVHTHAREHGVAIACFPPRTSDSGIEPICYREDLEVSAGQLRAALHERSGEAFDLRSNGSSLSGTLTCGEITGTITDSRPIASVVPATARPACPVAALAGIYTDETQHIDYNLVLDGPMSGVGQPIRGTVSYETSLMRQLRGSYHTGRGLLSLRYWTDDGSSDGPTILRLQAVPDGSGRCRLSGGGQLGGGLFSLKNGVTGAVDLRPTR
jgi:hypothetical protein